MKQRSISTGGSAIVESANVIGFHGCISIQDFDTNFVAPNHREACEQQGCGVRVNGSPMAKPSLAEANRQTRLSSQKNQAQQASNGFRYALNNIAKPTLRREQSAGC